MKGARPPKKAPAKAGALRRLTEKEIAAHEATGGGWGPGIVPRDSTLATLAHHGITGATAETIIDGGWDHLGRYGMDANLIDKRLTPTEIIAQARMTAEIARELEQRLRYMEPNIHGLAWGKAFNLWGERLLSPEFRTDLTRLHVLMDWVAKEVDTRARKTVTKRTGPRNRLLAEITEVVSAAMPNTTKEMAREVAADLLRCWGVQAPAADRKLRSAIARTK